MKLVQYQSCVYNVHVCMNMTVHVAETNEDCDSQQRLYLGIISGSPCQNLDIIFLFEQMVAEI